MTSVTWNPVFAAIVKFWSAPAFATIVPLGLIVPFAPAEALMVYVSIAKTAVIVWLDWTLMNV
jgi:hypothetical protein